MLKTLVSINVIALAMYVMLFRREEYIVHFRILVFIRCEFIILASPEFILFICIFYICSAVKLTLDANIDRLNK